ncbi:MAG: replication-associated recombination protein A [Chloroflexota bacterium]|nr:replication-associated recombination protein A [Chloroflexota bacterium]
MAAQAHLFDGAAGASPERVPLAARMRPRSLDEILGQVHLLAPGRALRRALDSDRVPSMVLWGPPGSGKTTLADVIARQTRARFIPMSAVTAGVADLRKAVEQARSRPSERTILFIDEIHRFNKGQQDAVLPYVENGTLTLIGATTENPSFEVNAALLSRVRVFVLRALSDADVELIVRRALEDAERGLGASGLRIEQAALRHLVERANGDARVALNALELAADATRAAGGATIELAVIEDAVQQRALQYDKAGDAHYDTISAFIKSIRGSDADAAVYWLARMLESGEDLMFIARRLVILAGEDVGLADPRALPVAVAAQQAAHFIGMPEAMFPLAEATLYLATAPKSNSVGRAYSAALQAVRDSRNEPVPLHLRNAVTGLMRGLGYGREYRYSHDYGLDDPRRWSQRYLPENLAGRRFYQPGDQGFEADELARRLAAIQALRETDA